MAEPYLLTTAVLHDSAPTELVASDIYTHSDALPTGCAEGPVCVPRETSRMGSFHTVGIRTFIGKAALNCTLSGTCSVALPWLAFCTKATEAFPYGNQ